MSEERREGGVADVAEAGADGAGDALGGESGFEERDALPVDEDVDDAGEGEGVEEEDAAGAGVGAFEGGDHEAAEGGADGAGEVVGGGIEGDGVGDEFAGDELGDDGLPGGIVHGGADVEQEGEGEQGPGGDVSEEGEDGEDRDRSEHPDLPEDEEAAAVKDVGGGAGKQAQDENGKGGRGLHESDEQRRGGEGGHQPGACGVLHPGADGRDGAGDPAIAEERDAERSEAGGGRGGGCRRRVWRGGEWHRALGSVYEVRVSWMLVDAEAGWRPRKGLGKKVA